MSARCYVRLTHPEKPTLYAGYYGALVEDWKQAVALPSLSVAMKTSCSLPKGYVRDVVLEETLKALDGPRQ